MFTLQQKNNISLVTVTASRLDVEIAVPFKNSIIELIKNGHRFIIIDLTEVELIDSSGLGALVTSLKHLGKNGDIILCGIQNEVRPLLELTRMNKVFTITATSEEAAAHLQSAMR